MSAPTALVRPPVHLLLGPEGHGVRRCAASLAAALGASTATDPDALLADRPRTTRVHLHLTDRLLARDPEAAAARVERWATRCRLTVTLHDVPQPTDGSAFAARRAAYARIVAAAEAWAVSSEHERDLVRALLPHGVRDRAGAVVPLPLDSLPVRSPGRTAPAPPGLPAGDTVGLFGWLYPGKGHAEVVRALGEARQRGALRRPVTVVSIGAVADGHDDLVDELAALAADHGVGWQVTGWLADDAAPAWLRHATVPVAGHRNVSASGSVNDWVAAGRRPLVRLSRYAEEVERLRPGCHLLWRDDELSGLLAAALADPASTRLTGPPPGPDRTAVAAAYARWWRGLEAGGSGGSGGSGAIARERTVTRG